MPWLPYAVAAVTSMEWRVVLPSGNVLVRVAAGHDRAS